MEKKNHTDAVPENHQGDSLDIESVKDFASIDDAVALFDKGKQRLLNVNEWQHVAGEALAHFTLTDPSGAPVGGQAQEGLLIKIDIPGPGTEEADGFDWVVIERIESEKNGHIESVAVRVRPTAAPGSETNETAHFYSQQSTSTFTISRDHLKVTAGVYDRNLEANQDSTKLWDKVRNAIIGFAGKKGVSAGQWKAFTNGLLEA
ncbi:hypothetical protein [Dyadobacter sp. CY326]|uniref:hypothetical protein n=1 Tax=Dyadobacter sp. CY326 TaxID=2907300 RepID=UPI001F416583|nr:hypothetical protein [Dyadobacter sp. CY326]MCE7064090.1 hypothetical protein [Dyadobacter sp. CY326]